jgi:hypothetical protein
MTTMMRVEPITNDALRRRHLPKPRAPFTEIVVFANSYDAFELHGRARSARLANAAVTTYAERGVLPDNLDTLRTCLFFEARRWILWRQEPNNDAHAYIWALIEAIGERIPAR